MPTVHERLSKYGAKRATLEGLVVAARKTVPGDYPKRVYVIGLRLLFADA